MTETTREILEKYQVRKTKKQKTAFIEYVKKTAELAGYDFKVEKGAFGARNIVIGDPDSAKVLYTAHYDTCARLPFPNFITPKNILVYLMYQLLIVGVFFVLSFGIGFGIGFIMAKIPMSEIAAELIIAVLPHFIIISLLLLMLFLLHV